MITSSAHLEIALGENEDTCYTVENDEFSEKNRYEEYPVYLPRQESENEVLGGLWRLKCGKSGWER